MVFIGMDHGTTGISFCIMSDEGDVIEVFKIGREESKKGLVNVTDELTRRLDLSDVKPGIRQEEGLGEKLRDFAQEHRIVIIAGFFMVFLVALIILILMKNKKK